MAGFVPRWWRGGRYPTGGQQIQSGLIGPDEGATAIEFPASPAASFITGTTLVVDGGILAGTGQFPAPAAP
jgi:NAD(P)-dependent dehydrogenase (short-subunit alcohol dehydrogenase family)